MNDESTAGSRGEGTRKGPVDCAPIRELLPLALAGTLSRQEEAGVDAHLARCEECRAEHRFLRRLVEARPRAPGSLAPGVMRSLDAGIPRRGQQGFLTWGLSAAAVVVLALGIGALWDRMQAPDPTWSLALDAPAESWGQEDWMVAGGALLDGVSEETLLALLEEM